MINKTLINDRLVLIDDPINKLKFLSQTQLDLFNDSLEAAAVESYLRRSLEAIFDIGRHILSKIGEKELAAEYKSIAQGLTQKGVVTPDLGQTLIEMAGYRNRLVHMYHQINDEELYQIIQNDLQDLEKFVSQIKLYIQE